MNQVFSIDHRRGAACDLERRTRQTRILVDATRDFTAKERPSNRDITAYKEMFYQWIDRILPADRRLLSTLLARSVFTPRAVAIYLATDTLDIAIPFLLYSPVLNELDLRNISEKKGQRHADVIARRQARPTAAPEGGATRREPLPKAEPVQPEKAEAKVQTIAREHPVRRESIPLGEAAVPTGPPVIDEAPQLAGEPLAATSAPAMAEEMLALASIGGRLGRDRTPHTGESDMPDRPAERATFTDRRYDRLPKRETGQLLALARRRDIDGLASAIAGLSGLEIPAIRALLTAEHGDEILYLIKALAPEPPRDLQLLLTAAPRFGRGIETYQAAKALLGDLDTGICRMIFNQVGATFELPRLDTVKTARTPSPQPAAAARPLAIPDRSTGSDFADRARERRQALSPRRQPVPRDQPAAMPPPARHAETATASHRDFRELFQDNVVVNFG